MILSRTWWIAFVVFFGSTVQAAEPTKPEYTSVANVKVDPFIAKMIEAKVKLSTAKVHPGEVVQIVVEVTPQPNCYTTSWNKKGPDQIPFRPRIKVSDANLFEVRYPVEETGKLIWKKDAAELIFKDSFTWTIDVLVSSTASLGSHKLAFDLALQVCNDNTCVPGKITAEETVEVTAGMARSTDKLKPAVTPAPWEKVDPPTDNQPKPSTDTPTPGKSPTSDNPDSKRFGAFLLLAAVSAFLMLLTPCVFPMIPITVSFFLKQGEKEHHNPLPTALIYSLTIIVVMSVSVILVGGVIISIATNKWVNLGLGIMLVFFALSLFGMYEIELPTFLSNWTLSRQDRGGYIGTIFMALTFTITSFTCTGPFLGPLLGGVSEFKLTWWQLLSGAVVYSTVFAAPFFLLALFPSLIKKLPRSGGWLNSIKVVMGFLELAAALKFFSITDAMLFPGRPMLFNYDTVLCAWIALSVLCGVYLLGLFRLPHDSPVESLSVVRMLIASLFFGMALYMWPALDRKQPLGWVGEQLVGFLPEDTRAPTQQAGGGSDSLKLKATYDLDEAYARAIAEKKLIFIDFTGTSCANCRYNEGSIFVLKDVHEELDKFVIVKLYTDTVPNPRLSPDESKSQADFNMDLQRNTYGDVSLPYYVLLRPDATNKKAVVNGKIQGQVLMTEKGKIEDPAAFAKQLQEAQKK